MNEPFPERRLLDLDAETEQRILKALDDFQGLGTTMESAIGALVMGQYFGWRVLKLLHNPATYRKYEKVLGIEFKDHCPPITEAGKKKSIGYAVTEAIGSFWAVITGKRKVTDKGMIESPEAVERRVAQFVKEEE
jgi:hypothetical protein